MNVACLIGMQMMPAMMRSPPQCALLRGRLRKHRENELKNAAGFVGAVRKISVIAAGDGKHPHPKQHRQANDRLNGKTRPEHAERAQMNNDEGSGAQPRILARRQQGVRWHYSLDLVARQNWPKWHDGGALLRQACLFGREM